MKTRKERVWSIQELCVDDNVFVYDVTQNWHEESGKVCCADTSVDKFVLYIYVDGRFKRFIRISDDMLQHQSIRLYKLVEEEPKIEEKPKVGDLYKGRFTNDIYEITAVHTIFEITNKTANTSCLVNSAYLNSMTPYDPIKEKQEKVKVAKNLLAIAEAELKEASAYQTSEGKHDDNA